MAISPEIILLVINLTTNCIVILKRIKICYSPCFSLDCRSSNELTEEEETLHEDGNNRNESNTFKKILNRLTPRSKTIMEKSEEIKNP